MNNRGRAVPTVTDTYEYDAFGNSFTTSGSTPNNYLYRGEQFDPDLGMYYLRARYYNPLTGRFMSRDPEGHSPTAPSELHKYLYASGDPVNAIDPTGRGDEISYVTITVKAITLAATVICGEVTVIDALLSPLNGWKSVFPPGIKWPCSLLSAYNFLTGGFARAVAAVAGTL